MINGGVPGGGGYASIASKGSAPMNGRCLIHRWSSNKTAPERNLTGRNLPGASRSLVIRDLYQLQILKGLVGDVESDLQSRGEIEVTSRVVGDMVISGLKEMDLVAYVRYAIVYLGLEDLNAIRGEIDALLEA